MDPDCSGGDDADSSDFLVNAIKYIQNTMSSEDLQDLLADAKIWEAFVNENVLSRDEADVIYEVLSGLITDTATEDKNEQEFRERFLKSYPQIQQQLKKHIAQLHELADKADKVHRDCTISNLVANSTGIVSGILTIVGLSLAPVTAGVSLALTATGVGLGTAATVTTVSTSIVEKVNMSFVEAEANTLSAGINEEKVVKELLCDHSSKIVSIGDTIFRGLNGIQKNARAIKLVKSQPQLAGRAARLMSGGKLSAQGTRQVEKAFGGTALAMTKGARIFGVVTAGATVLMDVVSLVENSKDLHKGAKTQSAENLRQEAQELEKKLEELNQIYDSLL
ncbi:apolipoprotein L2-like [Talpa occidentalis]|uniref:apolipoprotein L2-like n=1 Tax=Talpa occidentalis TaxID=50954 RepID=UPI00188ED476|nr:apolipoprotein L2-like [Talpa occidentalis]